MRREKSLFARIAAILTAVLLLSSCGTPKATTEAEETEDPNVGRYYVGALEHSGEQVPIAEDSVENIYLRLKDDGKVVLQLPEIKYDGSWKVKKDTLTLKFDSDDFDKEEYEGSIDDGIIDIVIDDIRMVCVKGKNAAKEYVKAHPATAPETTEEPTTEEPTTEEPTTEVPPATSAEQPTETEKPVTYSVYFAIYWNDWHPAREDIKKNYIAFPSDGSDAILLIEGKSFKIPWSYNNLELRLTIDGDEILTVFTEPEIRIEEDDIKAMFVFGTSFATEDWDKLFGGEPAESTTAEQPGGQVSEGFSVAEQVICDRDGIKVTVLRTVTDEYSGRGIEIKVENGTDKDIYVSGKQTEINGAMMDDDFYCRAEPGKTETETLYFNEDLLKGCSIDKIGYVSFYLHAVDRGTYDTLFDVEEKVVIKTGDYGREDKPQRPKDAVLIFEKDGIKAYFVSIGMDKYGYMYSLLYFENTTGRPVGIYEDNLQLNGIDVDGYISNDEIEDGCILFCDLEYDKDSLKAAGITSLDELTSAALSFEFYDLDSYDEIATTDVLTITLK